MGCSLLLIQQHSSSHQDSNITQKLTISQILSTHTTIPKLILRPKPDPPSWNEMALTLKNEIHTLKEMLHEWLEENQGLLKISETLITEVSNVIAGAKNGIHHDGDDALNSISSLLVEHELRRQTDHT